MRSREWPGFRSLLCPVDFSEPSRQALRYAAALAARAGASLTVEYANDPFLVAAAAAALHDRTLAKRSATELQRFIDATLPRQSRRRMRVRTRVSVGSPADEILKAVAAARSDLIVMGTHGLTGTGRLLMGSTTLGVLQRTTVPVLAVPPSADEVPPNLSKWPEGPVVAAVELDRQSRENVAVSASVARWLGSPLLLLHVVHEISAPAWLQGTLTGHERLLLAQAQRDLDALAAIARRRVTTDARVVCGRPADEIAAVVSAERSELLITALLDRRGWFGARRGSISYHVLSHAVAPVLAYPRQWRPSEMWPSASAARSATIS
jgi:nucleotide-binding universal stress UspA family protein